MSTLDPQRIPEGITQFINALGNGEELPLGELFAAVYNELHSIAHNERRRWHDQKTLSTTALVHEAFLKLWEQGSFKGESRAHFFNIAAQAMRYILINYAKRSRAEKRGGGSEHVPIEEALLIDESQIDELLALDEALTRLNEISPRKARVVECRFFAGLEVDETAEALGVSTATVMRDWRHGKAWLYRQLAARKRPQANGEQGADPERWRTTDD